ncbi:2'-5' RNA ligase family protein [Microvirga pudoricolor]|uniref:2'-5' RNA ligase family protein n=1 Tax=Microvirga pudoricolor TaxID=2778729 RepID=UPI00194E2C6A|nr:2'-5' RNA ligase family protein [Microvirga pudoricolor]MBM6593533.1 2'-5' RNA ligase family protein [Microvirga pudoricolor]
MHPPNPLILTLDLDEASFRFFDDQRKAYFPQERNFIPAHVTLFHHLPGSERRRIDSDVQPHCRRPVIAMRATGLRSLGRGVAYALESPEVDALRASLATSWADWLTPQDRQKPRLHVTVQNKVSPDAARTLLDRLNTGFEPFTATATGLLLWSYEGGPWRFLARFPFRG